LILLQYRRPLRTLLARRRHIRVVMAEVQDIDPKAGHVITDHGHFPFDELVIAAGMRNAYFGHEEEWETHAPGLKCLEEAMDIRRRILSRFEEAELSDDAQHQQALLTFVIVGAGPTGVELAGAISELAHHTLRSAYRRIDPDHTRILLIEASPHVLPVYPQSLRERARQDLEAMQVEVHTGCRVQSISHDQVVYLDADGSTITVPTHTTLWAAGQRASDLAQMLARRSGAELRRHDRVVVDAHCRLPQDPRIAVIGDMAYLCEGDGDEPLPGVAPVAMQQGRYLADCLRRRRLGKAVKPFHYRNKGLMATIGRHRAVAVSGPFHLKGWIAWVAWLFIHIIYLVQGQNRILVLIQWAYLYLTRNRSAQVITRASQPAHHGPSPDTPLSPARPSAGPKDAES
ncbi:MAG: NAD(P)/FAD-dependent oxidoreductase, partial [Planctomycetota bacterium]